MMNVTKKRVEVMQYLMHAVVLEIGVFVVMKVVHDLVLVWEMQLEIPFFLEK